MSEPLIRGEAGPAGLDYLLHFYDWESMWSPLMLYYASVAKDGTAIAELRDSFDDAFLYIENWRGYPVGQAVSGYDQNYGLVPGIGAVEAGVEIVLKYAGGTGHFDVGVSIVPNGDFYLELMGGNFPAGPGGELEVRILCLPKLVRVTVGNVVRMEADPATFDWEWVGLPQYYWLMLRVAAPYGEATATTPAQSVDRPWKYFPAAVIPHIREIAYYLPSKASPGERPRFFSDYVRSFERP